MFCKTSRSIFKKTNKHLLEIIIVKREIYKGLYDGLIDSDGHIEITKMKIK